MITDAGGSNGHRNRLWKVSLQELADDTGLRITMCHLQLGTSKWNKIKHRILVKRARRRQARPKVPRGKEGKKATRHGWGA